MLQRKLDAPCGLNYHRPNLCVGGRSRNAVMACTRILGIGLALGSGSVLAEELALPPLLPQQSAPELLLYDQPPAAMVDETIDTLPPLAEEVPASSEPIKSHSDLWTHLRTGFSLPDLDDPLVAKHEAWYAARPEYVSRMVERSQRYLYFIVAEVEKRHMPLEVALLPMIESAFNPMALSRSRASGIWQFIPSTGRHYGLQQIWWLDERR